MRVITFAGLFLLAVMSACQSAPTRMVDSTAPMRGAAISEVTPAEALPSTSAAYSQFIDVRTNEEYAAGHADRARNIPLDQLAAKLDVLEKNEPVYLICRTDNRSSQAAKILVDAGFKQAIVIKGGTEAWKAGGLPMGK
jgi:rhodanese-related sulfurtransferase